MTPRCKEKIARNFRRLAIEFREHATFEEWLQASRKRSDVWGPDSYESWMKVNQDLATEHDYIASLVEADLAVTDGVVVQ